MSKVLILRQATGSELAREARPFPSFLRLPQLQRERSSANGARVLSPRLPRGQRRGQVGEHTATAA